MHANETTLRNLITAFQASDVATIMAIFKPNIKWRWLGTEFITDIKAGTYIGIEEVAATLSGIDSKITEYSINEIKAISASDQIGVIWMACSYKDEHGVHQEMEENWVFLFEDGLVSEVWDYSRMVFLEKVRNGEIAQA